MNARLRHLPLRDGSVRCPPMFTSRSAASATCRSSFQDTPTLRSRPSRTSAEEPASPNASVTALKYARFTDLSRSQVAPDASMQVDGAICSTKYTSHPRRARPTAQLTRVHAPPPLAGLFSTAPETTAITTLPGRRGGSVPRGSVLAHFDSTFKG